MLPWVFMAAMLACSALARAAFHFSEIDEVMSGITGDPSVQFVELRMKASLQNNVAHTRLTAFDCTGTATVLLEIPTNLATDGADVRWIIASPDALTFAGAFAVTPDFIFPGSIDPSCGNICWGAPGMFPPNPPTWDATMPSNYVDCLAYGNYTGPLKPGQPVVAGALGDGAFSLTRTVGTSTFALQCPSPQNDAGTMGGLPGCIPPPTTPTTTVVTTTTVGVTTTTLHPSCTDTEGIAAVRAQIEAACPCAAATSHRKYVHCAAGILAGAIKGGTIRKVCKPSVKKCVAGSTCGRAGAVTCCRTTAKGVLRCSIKKSVAACKPPKGGAVCVGSRPSCCDACGTDTCAAATTPGTSVTTTTRRPRPSTTQPYGE